MKAISLWEPWATAIAIGAKKIETRGWYTGYRGKLAIHAAKTRDHADVFLFVPIVRDAFAAAGITEVGHLAFGCIVATCRLAACWKTEHIVGGIGELERALGGYEAGRFGWVLEDIVRLEKPIPARGSQGFWEWNAMGEVIADKPMPEPDFFRPS